MVATIKIFWILLFSAIFELNWKETDSSGTSFLDVKAEDDSREILGAKRFISELQSQAAGGSRNIRYGAAYTAWSGWSNCSIQKCTQSRRRHCKMKRRCGDTVQIEEKRCKFSRTHARKRVKCGRKRWKDRNKHYNEHSEKFYNSMKNVTRNAAGLQNRRKYKFKIVSNQKDALERKVLPSKSSKWYSRWSRWSPCSRACITHRKRWCKRPKLCRRDIIKETAYCYVEGTYCQKWIKKKIQSNKNNPNGELLVETILEEVHNRDRNDIEESNSIRHTVTHPQCGILYSSRNATSKKNALSMARIIGGRPSPKGKWPWQVAVLNKYKEAFCGGTLVSTRWVLTAAHCIRRRLYVRLGEYNLAAKDDTEIEMRITQTIVHPGYDSETVDNDVALLRLPSVSRHSRNLGVACLPKYKQPLPVNKLCTIIGWGKRRSTDVYGTDILHEAQVPIVVTDVCKNTYVDYYITSNMFCAGYRKGRMDSCAGDSGGPLLCKDPLQPNHPWTIFGITSFGDGCGKKGKYGIYARLPNYVQWINKVIKLSDYHDR